MLSVYLSDSVRDVTEDGSGLASALSHASDPRPLRGRTLRQTRVVIPLNTTTRPQVAKNHPHDHASPSSHHEIAQDTTALPSSISRDGNHGAYAHIHSSAYSSP